MKWRPPPTGEFMDVNRGPCNTPAYTKRKGGPTGSRAERGGMVQGGAGRCRAVQGGAVRDGAGRCRVAQGGAEPTDLTPGRGPPTFTARYQRRPELTNLTRTGAPLGL